MATSRYFRQGASYEKTLYEDLIIEAIKIHGVDSYYCPRTVDKTDKVLNEDGISSFVDAFPTEVYIESFDAYEGDGNLMSKFGLEMRNQLKIVVARRTWKSSVGKYGKGFNSYRPSEGDLVYIPMINGIFEVKYVDLESPFYQLKNLPVYKMTIELFEYRSERIDTGVPGIDGIQAKHSTGTTLGFEYLYALATRTDSGGDIRVLSDGTTIRVSAVMDATIIPFKVSDKVSLDAGDGRVFGTAEVLKIDGSKISISPITFVNGSEVSPSLNWMIVSDSTGTVSRVTSLYDLTDGSDVDTSGMNDPFAKNATFEAEGDAILDFTEHNPFGEP